MSLSLFVNWDLIIHALKSVNYSDALKMLNTVLELKKERDIGLYINLVVEAEILKRVSVTNRLLDVEEVEIFLSVFERLPITEKIEQEYIKLVEFYRINPYDAVILTACKHHRVPYILTKSKIMEEVAKKIELFPITSSEALLKLFPPS